MQIPAYVFNFLLGCLGLVMGIWGFGIILFVAALDLVTICITGVSSVGCCVKSKKENFMPRAMATICGVCSFLYCVDIVAAIVYFVAAKKSLTKNPNAE